MWKTLLVLKCPLELQPLLVLMPRQELEVTCSSLFLLFSRIVIFLNSSFADFNNTFWSLFRFFAEDFEDNYSILICSINNSPSCVLINNPQFMALFANIWHGSRLRHV